MADFKSIIAKMKDNDKNALYLNSYRGFKRTKKHEEITMITEMGWSQKVVTGQAVAMLLIIDKDEFENICKEVDAETARQGA